MRRSILCAAALALAAGCVASHEPVPDDAPLPGDLLEIDLTDGQREALCEWWFNRHVEGTVATPTADGGTAYIFSCPPGMSWVLACAVVLPEYGLDCEATVQDWYNCELTQPRWWCEDPIPEECRRPPNCGSSFFSHDARAIHRSPDPEDAPRSTRTRPPRPRLRAWSRAAS